MDAASSASVPRVDRSRHKQALVALASLTAVALDVLLTAQWLRSKSTGIPPIRSVALLPIQNLTGDPSLDTVADKLTEDAMYVLGRSGQIHVATRNAVFVLKGKPVNERRLGKELNVLHLVNEAAQRAGGHTTELGLVHLFLREYEAAIAELRKQAVVAPKDPRAPFFLSAALELTGNHATAILGVAGTMT